MKQKILLLLLMVFCSITAAYAAPVTIDPAHLGLSALVFFGVGILLAFTPCVLPMIPILSGILIGQKSISTWRAFQLSLTFVLGMAVTYAIAGIAAGYLGGTIQTMLQIPWIIIGFSLIFVIMAFAMFGWFDLKMPSFILNRVQYMSDKLTSRTLISVVLLGMLSTLIASPCVTPPLISILTYIGNEGNALVGGVLLFVLALGMGLPLILFGVGQGILLPRTGVWMIQVKNLFGIMMLGLSIWILSRLLANEVTMFLLAILIIISAICFGAFNFNREKMQTRIIHAISFLALVYGVVLMVGALSGNEDLLHPLKSNMAYHMQTNVRPPHELFATITTFSALDRRLAAAKSKHKPVMIEFYAGWCPDCRALDKNVLSNPKIQELMQAFETIRIDITQDNDELKKLRKRYRIYGVPSMVFYDKTGQELTGEGPEELTKEFVERKLVELS